MIIFAFTVLSLFLFAIGGFFAYRTVKQEFETALKAHVIHSRVKIRAQAKTITEMSKHIEQIEANIKLIAAEKKVNLTTSLNFRENMEDRHIRDNPQVVAVDNVMQVVNQ